MNDQSTNPTPPAREGEVRTYRGRTIEELIPRIRAELGTGAVILRERQGLVGGIGGFFAQRCVEIDAQAGPRVNVYADEPTEDAVIAGPATDAVDATAVTDGYADELGLPEPEPVAASAPAFAARLTEAAAAPTYEPAYAAVGAHQENAYASVGATSETSAPGSTAEPMYAGAGYAAQPEYAPVAEHAYTRAAEHGYTPATPEHAPGEYGHVLAAEIAQAPTAAPSYAPSADPYEPAAETVAPYAPEPTWTPVAEAAPIPEPTWTPAPVPEAAYTPEPTWTPAPAAAPEPVQAPIAEMAPVHTPEPAWAPTPDPVPTVAAAIPATPEPIWTPAPTPTPTYAAAYVPAPIAEQAPAATPLPAIAAMPACAPVAVEPAQVTESVPPSAPAWLPVAEAAAADQPLLTPTAPTGGGAAPAVFTPATPAPPGPVAHQIPTPTIDAMLAPAAHPIAATAPIVAPVADTTYAPAPGEITQTPTPHVDPPAAVPPVGVVAAAAAAPGFIAFDELDGAAAPAPAAPAPEVDPSPFRTVAHAPGEAPVDPGHPAANEIPIQIAIENATPEVPAVAPRLTTAAEIIAAMPQPTTTAPEMIAAMPEPVAAAPHPVSAPEAVTTPQPAGLEAMAPAIDAAPTIDAAPAPAGPSVAVAAVTRRLTERGISPVFADALLAEVAVDLAAEQASEATLTTALRTFLVGALPQAAPLPIGGGAIAIVGPGGSGKTRAVAGLARAVARAGHRVAVARLGGPERALELAEMLAGEDVEVLPAMRTRATVRAVASARERGLVVIDTTAIDPGERSAAEVLAETLDQFELDGLLLTVPAGLSARAAVRLVSGYAALAPTGMIATHLEADDELGAIVEVALRLRVPAGHVLCAPGVGGGMSALDPAAVAERLLR